MRKNMYNIENERERERKKIAKKHMSDHVRRYYMKSGFFAAASIFIQKVEFRVINSGIRQAFD